MGANLGRVPPQDLDAESAVLAAVLLNPEALDRVRDLLPSGEDFYSEANQRIYEAAIAVSDAGQSPDVVTVASHLAKAKRLAQAGGPGYLAQITYSPAVVNVEDYAAIVSERARQRRVIHACQRFAVEGYGDVGNVDEWCQAVEQGVFEVTEARHARQGPEALSAIVPRRMQQLGEQASGKAPVRGVSTGLRDLDRLIYLLEPGDLYIVAGRPGMGKTGWLLSVALNVARRDGLVAFMSLEMPREQLANRLLAIESGINSEHIRKGEIHRDDWSLLIDASTKLRELPIWIDDRPGATLAETRSVCRRAQRVHGKPLRLLCVDYLQLMSGKRERGDTREAEVASLSRGLKALAKQLDCAVLASAQLNRGVELRPNKRPTLADLRESGQIEQDADTIMFLYRDEYYNKESQDKGVAECIAAKQRHGKTGSCSLHFMADRTAFYDLAAEWDDVGQDGG